MKLYVVRQIKDKQAVGIFWVQNIDDLLWVVDEVSEPADCEYQIAAGGGIGWYGYAPSIGIKRDVDDPAFSNLMAGASLLGDLETHLLYGEFEQWRPLIAPSRATVSSAAPPPPKRNVLPEPTNTVYIIQCDDHVKIWVTSGPVAKRLKALSTAHHRELTLLAKIENAAGDLESSLHARFSAHRGRGEWFRLDGELKEWIEGGCKL